MQAGNIAAVELLLQHGSDDAQQQESPPMSGPVIACRRTLVSPIWILFFRLYIDYISTTFLPAGAAVGPCRQAWVHCPHGQHQLQCDLCIEFYNIRKVCIMYCRHPALSFTFRKGKHCHSQSARGHRPTIAKLLLQAKASVAHTCIHPACTSTARPSPLPHIAACTKVD